MKSHVKICSKWLTKKCYNVINVPDLICDHIFGETHSHKHRMIIGSLIMCVGITVTKVFTGLNPLLTISSDIIGYLIHGVGITPFINYLTVKNSAE